MILKHNFNEIKGNEINDVYRNIGFEIIKLNKIKNINDVYMNYDLKYYIKLHELSILRVYKTRKYNYIITISNDFSLKIHDHNYELIFNIKNPNNCKYINFVYNSNSFDIIIIDELGYLQIWNIKKYQLLYEIKISNHKINYINLINNNNDIILSNEKYIKIYKLTRNIIPKYGYGHKNDIISILIIPSTNKDLNSIDTLLYTSGLDNKIILWDYKTLNIKGIFGKKQNSDISCMTMYPNTKCLITGHHNGTLIWWTSNGKPTKLPHAHREPVRDITTLFTTQESVFRQVCIFISTQNNILITQASIFTIIFPFQYHYHFHILWMYYLLHQTFPDE